MEIAGLFPVIFDLSFLKGSLLSIPWIAHIYLRDRLQGLQEVHWLLFNLVSSEFLDIFNLSYYPSFIRRGCSYNNAKSLGTPLTVIVLFLSVYPLQRSCFLPTARTVLLEILWYMVFIDLVSSLCPLK